MKEYLYGLLGQGKTLTIEEIFTHMLVASVIALVIFLSYMQTHAGAVYSMKFNVSLVMLTVLTTMVMIVIGNNIALSLGMVGALSIVRFRTAIKDSRDTAYIFWTVIVGICCGAGDYQVAGIGTAVVFFLLLLLGRIKNDNRVLLIVRGPRNNERRIEAIVFDYYSAKANMRVKNTTEHSVEFIFEISKKMVEKTAAKDKSIVDLLYELENMEYVNLVSQNDEVNS
ncbi:MAG TPA: DUF4956 domain-containing protein [Bacillota bacterium]|nr:DUF4956 domain-containing protein [Bacillota bacterium]